MNVPFQLVCYKATANSSAGFNDNIVYVGPFDANIVVDPLIN